MHTLELDHEFTGIFLCSRLAHQRPQKQPTVPSLYPLGSAGEASESEVRFPAEIMESKNKNKNAVVIL